MLKEYTSCFLQGMIEYAASLLHAPKHDLKHDMNNKTAKGSWAKESGEGNEKIWKK